jgi:hypothetical protein
MRYALSSKADMVKLIGIAAHEVTHVVVDTHDENYASVLTDMIEVYPCYLNDILNAMKESKNVLEAVGHIE